MARVCETCCFQDSLVDRVGHNRRGHAIAGPARGGTNGVNHHRRVARIGDAGHWRLRPGQRHNAKSVMVTCLCVFQPVHNMNRDVQRKL